MKVYDYKVIMEPDENGGYIVTCPSFTGCYSQGDTIEEALANIREAILLCIEDIEEEGEEIPDPSRSLIATVMVEV
ncbi:MAG: type II toxin-antitoxin system HicB family antitoxin [Candidatus Thermoplasmatota archaeon]|jgi:predicted RNase H-like HicB family nuclease|nr:type II toxin-antitoxin system HicB family antitoxin [Candidatus Thermoplasmatota archaeon]MDP7264474.1 type II toxin-antitoxin system HicB family antitoxin [Candidatus Thermoplasmatota archaeon]